MHAVLVLVALSLPTQADPPAVTPRPIPARPVPPPAAAEEGPRPFTLDELAAGARNDAFVDEYLKGKQVTLLGSVQKIERMNSEGDPLGDPVTLYRVVMHRLGHDAESLDVDVHLYFAASARKDLALLEPGVAKIAVHGKCTGTQLESLQRGLNFLVQVQDCKIVPTPLELEPNPPRQRTPIIPNVIPDSAPPILPMPPRPMPVPVPPDAPPAPIAPAVPPPPPPPAPMAVLP